MVAVLKLARVLRLVTGDQTEVAVLDELVPTLSLGVRQSLQPLLSDTERFGRWCLGMRKVIEGFLPFEEQEKERTLPSLELTLQFTLMSIGFRTHLPLPAARPWLSVSGKAEDVLAYHVLKLCEAAGADFIFRCACGTVFVKVGKRKFCSARCQGRFYMRDRREAERKELEELTRQPNRRGHGKTTRKR